MREGPHGARDLPHPHRLPRALQPLEIPARLDEPQGGLEAKGHGLRVDAVGPAHAEGVFVLERQHLDHAPEALEARQDELRRLLKLQRLSRVHHVRGGEADVNEARVGAEGLLEVGQEGDHVVPGGGFDLVDPLRVDGGAGLDPAEGVHRDDAAAPVDLADGQLDPEPGLVLRLLAPDPGHLRSAVAGDHACLHRLAFVPAFALGISSEGARAAIFADPRAPGSSARAGSRRTRGG
jgi:hypothetical protein